ncbi:MAG: dihydroorotate dehydrogenase electron transfer subunit [Eubacterium sp.]|nr:dihydroorotate dehydrogenase electron transfer subunit [Eubacterium sp.]
MKKETAKVLSQNRIADEIYSMWIECEVANSAKPGQFIDVYVNDDSKLLPRPISICEVGENKLRIVYRVVGGGTKLMSTYKNGDDLDIIGPLGNGFDLKERKAVLVAGGIGIPPMVELAKQLSKEIGKENVLSVLGYRDELFLVEELEKYSEVIVTTEDGSAGIKGTVIDGLKESLDGIVEACGGISSSPLEEGSGAGRVVYGCGPIPMLKAVKEWALDESRPNKIEQCQISLEERMACGIGACLACVCKTKEKDEHSNVCNKRICKDGPVFDANDVIL